MKQNADYIHTFNGIATALILLFGLALAGPVAGAGDDEPEEAPKYSKGVKQCMACHREGRERPAHEVFFTTMGVTGDPNSPFAKLLALKEQLESNKEQ